MTDPMLKLEETIDDMTQALANSAKVNNQQKLMIEIIKNSKEAKKFDEFCKAAEAETKKNDDNYATLLEHRNMLADALNACKTADEPTRTVLASVLYKVFVAFNFIVEPKEDKSKDA